MPQNHKHIEWVDTVKGIAITAVVLCHISFTGGSELRPFLGNFWHVGVFFIVAGFFVKWEKLCRPFTFLKPKVTTLYLPATIIYSLAFLLHNTFVRCGWYPLGQSHPGNGQPFALLEANEVLAGILKSALCIPKGELVMGAMWFLYTLIYSFVILTILAWGIEKAVARRNWTGQKKSMLMLLVALCLQFGALLFTNMYSITIPRLSTACTAVALICIGKAMFQDWQCKFDNVFIFLIACIIAVQSIVFDGGQITLASNRYHDMLQLDMGCASVLYIIAFVAKKFESSLIAKGFAYLGKESLYIMALHILGFFCCNTLLLHMGVYGSNSHSYYTYEINGSPLIVLAYLAFGLAVPVVIINIYRFAVKNVVKICKNKAA